MGMYMKQWGLQEFGFGYELMQSKHYSHNTHLNNYLILKGELSRCDSSLRDAG